MNKVKKFFTNNPGLLVIGFVYLLTLIYMLPLRNQGFQDDWAYIQSVRSTLETGSLKVSDWVAPSSVFQIYWGIVFSKIFGFSMKTMHLSTVSLLLIALIFFYLLLKRLKVDEVKSVIFTFLLLSFPWVFQFSYTFLSEVPYMSLLIISLYFYTKGIQEDHSSSYLLGSLFAAFAFLIRQIGIVVPAATILAVVYTDICRKRFHLLKYVKILAPFAITVGLYFFWLSKPGNKTVGQFQVDATLKKNLIYYLPVRLGFSGISNLFYSEFLQRILFYFHYLVGFLVPFFLIFKIKIKSILKFLNENKLAISIGYLIYAIFLGIEYFFHYGRPKYELKYPGLVTNYDHLSYLDWRYAWQYLVGFSVILIIPIVAVALKKIFASVLKPKEHSNKKIFLLGAIALIFALIARQYLEFVAVFKPRIPLNASFVKRRVILQDSIFSASGLEVLYYDWLVFCSLFVILMIIIFLITHFQFKTGKKILKPEIGLIFLAFIFQSSMIIFLGYYHWQQYVISLIAYCFIGLAVFSRNWKINTLKALIVVVFMLVFSASLTKSRYNTMGFQWEMGTELVEQGVAPIDIDVSEEAWLPWWYYEKTFEDKVKELGGDKFKIGITSTWRVVTHQSKYSYGVIEVPLQSTPPSRQGIEIILDSGIKNSTLFSKKRFVAIRQKYGQ